MPDKTVGNAPTNSDGEEATEHNVPAGGSGPRSEGLDPDSANPDQSGSAGISPQPETSGGRNSKPEPVLTSIDRERIDNEF
ncbi:MAG: hypothetical protein M3R04_05135 [bacterium]|nr:hypothetical protein [bacterium]